MSDLSAIMDDMVTDQTFATPLFGRRLELTQLLGAVGLVDGEQTASVLLGGDAGIGKTRLLRELAATAADAGHGVVVGHCLDLGDGAMPYQPFAEAFATVDDVRRDELAERFPALAPLLPWPSSEQTGGVDRAELFASVVAGLDLLAAGQPLLLIIEDAHWADVSTRHLIRYVLAYLFTHPVHVVVSYRADDLHRRHPLRQAIAEWIRLPGVRRVELSPLDDSDIAELVRSRGDVGLVGGGLAAVVQRAAGNAFFRRGTARRRTGRHEGGPARDLRRSAARASRPARRRRPPGRPGRILRRRPGHVEAGEAAVRLSGYDEAAHHYEQALELLDSAPDDTDVVGLVAAAADAWMTSGHLLRALALLGEHLDALPAGAPSHDRARLLITIGNMAYLAERDAEAGRASEQAPELLGDERTVLRARAEALRSLVLSDAWRDEEALEIGEYALALAEELEAGDVIAEVTVTLARVLSRTGGADLGKSRQRYDELIDRSHADGNVLGELRGLHNLAFVLFNAGELDDAERAFRAAMVRAEATGRAWAPYGFDGRAFAAVICYIRGRWDDALTLQTVGVGAPMLTEAILAGGALMVAAGRGDTDALAEEPRLRAMWERDIALTVHSSAALIDLHGDSGDLQGARVVHRDVVQIMTEVWNSRLFAGHLRLSGLIVGQLASAAGRLSRSEQADLVDEASALEATAAEVVEVNPTLGPEGHAWRLRLTAEAALRGGADGHSARRGT